ncbi:MAG TPA: transglycosylase SLT domain-containing protein [Nitrospiraceae bacterium]|jgi:soluble lytic murein transglycosylase-like protein|nr:transglycosylase SLT domain-containing protein [Nitrospiraceae bacterium]HXC67614.1 transglycosylase SLT domain-containing protein [Nitrospiraceae bacterium]
MATEDTKNGLLCSRLLRTSCALVVMLCLLIAAAPTPTKPDYDGAYPRYSKQEIRRAIAWSAKKYHLDPALLRAVIKTESDFRQHAVSPKGAVGLMQLTPATAARLRVNDSYDSIQNIRGGAKQLRHLLNLYQGDLPLALAAYNAGVHRVKDHKVPRIRETRAYVRKVLRYYEIFRSPPQPPPKNDKKRALTRSSSHSHAY